MGFADIGAEVPMLEVSPTRVSLFRFSAVTWNPHRIHYDRAYAATEGYPDVVVHGHLHGCWLLSAVCGWLGSHGVVHTFSWQNRHYAIPGDVLTITGRVAAADNDLRTIDLEERNQDGVLCAPARAVVRLSGNEVRT